MLGLPKKRQDTDELGVGDAIVDLTKAQFVLSRMGETAAPDDLIRLRDRLQEALNAFKIKTTIQCDIRKAGSDIVQEARDADASTPRELMRKGARDDCCGIRAVSPVIPDKTSKRKKK